MNSKLQLARDEGNRQFPYLDCCGKDWRECVCAEKGNLTVGIGRNLDAKGLDESERALMLEHDLYEARQQLSHFLPWTDYLDAARHGVLVNMTFNMGIKGLLSFQKMLAAIQSENWVEAANELIDSNYGRGPTKNRAARLAKQLVTGEWQ